MMEHMQLSDMPQMCSEVKKWLNTRYGAEEGQKIWAATSNQYNKYLEEIPDYGGKKKQPCTCNLRKHHYLFSVSPAAGSSAGGGTSGICDRYVYVWFCKNGKDF